MKPVVAVVSGDKKLKPLDAKILNWQTLFVVSFYLLIFVHRHFFFLIKFQFNLVFFLYEENSFYKNINKMRWYRTSVYTEKERIVVNFERNRCHRD